MLTQLLIELRLYFYSILIYHYFYCVLLPFDFLKKRNLDYQLDFNVNTWNFNLKISLSAFYNL